jgi:hypothetical protein
LPHGEGLHHLVRFRVADEKVRTRVILILEEDPSGRVHGCFVSLQRFPRRGRTGTFQLRPPRKAQPGSLFSPGTARAIIQDGNLCRKVAALLHLVAASLPLPLSVDTRRVCPHRRPQRGQIRISLLRSGVVTHRSRNANWPVSFTSRAASSKPVMAAR